MPESLFNIIIIVRYFYYILIISDLAKCFKYLFISAVKLCYCALLMAFESLKNYTQ